MVLLTLHVIIYNNKGIYRYPPKEGAHGAWEEEVIAIYTASWM